MGQTKPPLGRKRPPPFEQLAFAFDAPPSETPASAPPSMGDVGASNRADPPPQAETLSTQIRRLKRRAPARSMAPQFHPGCLGRHPPAPLSGELPMNGKRAAHFLGKRVKWLETVRHLPNSPPWIKSGGSFEYFESQLAWWRAVLNDGGETR